MEFENDDNLDYELNKIASNIIKEKRLAKGYSLEELANKLNNIITRQSLFRYENNEARMKNRIFKKICLALDEDPNIIWNEINNRLIGYDVPINDSNINNQNITELDQVLFSKVKELSEEDKKAVLGVINAIHKDVDKELDSQ